MRERRDRNATGRSEERNRSADRRGKQYTRPELTVYGRLPELTSAGVGSKSEGPGYYTA
jgi:hypothetical protein